MWIVPQILLPLIEMERQRQSAGTPPAADTIQQICQMFLSLLTVSMDGKSRLSLTDPQPAGDLLARPQNHLTRLFKNDVARQRVRDVVMDAFNQFFVIDPTGLGSLRIRMAARAPVDSTEEQALDQRSRDFHSAAIDISELSDGVRAFTGLVSALVSYDSQVILVDEADAFLHPPLAKKLGATMALLANERHSTVFASTHSPHYLMGCIESGAKLNIVRLTYQSGTPTARVLTNDRIRELMRDPLLRSTGVLAALFHAGAVVSEADRDRAFYEEINLRLSMAKKGGAVDAVFLNAQNKQTVRRIVRPLREMGIPAAAVVDFDIVKGTDLSDLLSACFVPQTLIHSITTLRGDIEARFRALNLDMKQGGISLLTKQDDVSACKSLLQQLSQYGIFIVPNGEVESWLSYLGVNAAKENWLTIMFEIMGSDPTAAGYVQPRIDDVWEFVKDVGLWLGNPNRLGMPS
jgi:energy-coupling factor transporter ATP-binding protein EcfA2